MGVIADRLRLTGDQRTKIKAAWRQTAEAAKAIRANAALTAEQQHEQIAALRKSTREQMRAMLTPEQQTKLAEIRNHPRMLHALAVRRVRAAAVANRLGLTTEQRAKIHNIRGATRAAVAQVRSDPALTPEQKRAKVRVLVKANRLEARGVLTPDQQKKLDGMRGHFQARLAPPV